MNQTPLGQKKKRKKKTKQNRKTRQSETDQLEELKKWRSLLPPSPKKYPDAEEEKSSKKKLKNSVKLQQMSVGESGRRGDASATTIPAEVGGSDDVFSGFDENH